VHLANRTRKGRSSETPTPTIKTIFPTEPVMKKYLLFAVLLGAIAFSGVSFLANAEPETGKVETVIEKAIAAEAETDIAAPVSADAAAPAVDAFATDIEDCQAGIEAGSNGQQLDAETYQNTLISCMNAKGYSAEDVKSGYLDHQTTDEAPEAGATEAFEGGMMQE